MIQHDRIPMPHAILPKCVGLSSYYMTLKVYWILNQRSFQQAYSMPLQE